jgi:hypothetical protein
MKKLTFLFMAFASLNTFGQALPGSAPRGINCATDDPLHPIAGRSYTYQTSSTQSGNFTFWATKDETFIRSDAGGSISNISTMLNSPTTPTPGNDLIQTSSNYGSAAAANSVQITWSDAVLSGTTTEAPTFVAVKKDGTCSDNFKVWVLQPIKAFTVDIKNMNEAALNVPLNYDAEESQCFDLVRGARYNSGTMVYDYGKNTLYFEVIASNFSRSWTPTFTLTGLMPQNTPVQTSVIEWTYDNPATKAWDATTIWHPMNEVVNTNEIDTSKGVSIYVRVTITNNNYEGINPVTITLAVDGVNSAGQWDIENNTQTNPGPLCNAGSLNDHADAATQTINPRPNLDPVNPPGFVDGNNVN